MYQHIILVEKTLGVLKKYQNLCFMVHSILLGSVLLGRPSVNVLGTIYLEDFYTEVFSTAGFYRASVSARGFFSLLDHQYDIISVLIRLAFCPSCPFKWSVLVVLPCNFDWCFSHRHFVRAPHDLSHYEMSHNNPRPLFRKSWSSTAEVIKYNRKVPLMKVPGTFGTISVKAGK